MCPSSRLQPVHVKAVSISFQQLEQSFLQQIMSAHCRSSIVLFNALQILDLDHIDAVVVLKFLGNFFYLFLSSTFLGVFVGWIAQCIHHQEVIHWKSSRWIVIKVKDDLLIVVQMDDWFRLSGRTLVAQASSLLHLLDAASTTSQLNSKTTKPR
ncbi:hypothetical protein GUJ93_ZPchr0013g34118 [Zizania palustris]|uniref:Uncharacterized protein n=1 Tax=Zizania palustris TaxID=103762 RepID=A0A8J6C4A3_ZIZPA|nr:hypothetical protein GUJ93_ZPchr0013g34118 [Zizania palustris]